MENLITAKGLGKIYKGTGTETVALHDVDFRIEKGSFTVILGPSGAGKTTLLNLLGGMDFASSGSLLINGQDISKLNKKELTKYRRDEVGFVFQFYNLMPNLTAIENVELAVEVSKNHLEPKDVLADVGLEERAKNFPSQLSGGEQQRVSIARAIAKNPLLLLCDEPTGALDGRTGKTILKLLREQSKTRGITVIVVTHNAVIQEVADKVIRIKNGTIESIVDNPAPKEVEELEL